MAILKKVPKDAPFAHAGFQALVLWEQKKVKDVLKAAAILNYSPEDAVYNEPEVGSRPVYEVEVTPIDKKKKEKKKDYEDKGIDVA